MELVKQAQTFKSNNESFQNLRQKTVNRCLLFQFGVLYIGTFAVCLSFFKPHFDYFTFESSIANIIFGVFERIAIIFSASLSICNGIYFGSIFQAVPVEFEILGQSFENALELMEKPDFDEHHLDVLMENIEVHIKHHQKLLE